MYCTKCGIELGGNANFCSKCGDSLATAHPVSPKARDWNLHVSVLGWLVIAHAAMTGLIGFIVMFGGMFVRNVIARNPEFLLDGTSPSDVPPPEVFALIGPVSFLIGVIFLLIALPSVAAGVGLLRYRSWGRGLTLVLSFLRLLEVPFGTATAIYSFWVLLSKEGRDFYQQRAERVEA